MARSSMIAVKSQTRRLSSLISARAAAKISVGQVVEGAKGHYRLVQALSTTGDIPTVFKAEVLSARVSENFPARWVVIKTVAPGHWQTRKNLKTEYDAYKRHGIVRCSSFRALHDFIGNPEDLGIEASLSPPCSVLEWMETTLQDVPPPDHRKNYVLHEAIVTACLSCLVTMGKEKLLHSDLTPANVLVSGLGTDKPVVKLGDLGLVRSDGFEGDSQPYAMRAPEVYQGLGCFHRSETWTLAATIFCWLYPNITGTPGNKYGIVPEAWCIGKLMKLFPEWDGPPSDDNLCIRAFRVARMLLIEPDPEKPGETVLKVGSMDDEMQRLGVEPVLADLLRSMFVTDYEKRPSAAEVLRSKEYLALRKVALGA